MPPSLRALSAFAARLAQSFGFVAQQVYGMSHSLAQKRAATLSIEKLDLPANLRPKALAFAASDSKAGNSRRDLIELNDDDDLEPAGVSFFEEQAAGRECLHNQLQ